MAIVDFEQDPDAPFGSGNFRDDSGRIMYVHDPDTASTFVKTLAKTNKGIAEKAMGAAAPKAQPDQRLAMNDTGAPIPTGDMSIPAPPMPPTTPVSGTDAAANMSVTPEEVQSLSPEAAVSAVSKVTAPSAPAPPAAAPTGPQKLVETISKATGSGLPIAAVNTTRSRNVVRGRPDEAVDAQVQAEESVGTETDDALLGAGREKDEAAANALDRQREAAAAKGERERTRMREAQAKRQAAIDEKTRLEAELKKNDESLDPERFINNMSTGKSIGMALLAALNGGFGAIIGQKENGVMRVLQDKIDADIDRQKQEIASGRIRIGNTINELMQRGMRLEDAEALARDRADAAVDLVAELEAKRLGIEGENLKQAQLLVQQRREQRAARRGDLLAQKEDKIQEAESQVVHREAPKPAGAGLDDLLKKVQLESAYMKLANDRTQQMNAYELSKRAFGTDEKGEPRRLLSPEETKALQDKVAQVGPALAESAGAVSMTKVLVETLGGKLNETTGEITWPDDVQGVGPVDVHGGYTGGLTKGLRMAGLYRADIDKARDAQEALKQQVTSMITGANSSLKQDATFGSMVGGDFSNEEQTKENVQNWARTLFASRKQHMARLGTEGMAVMNANQLEAEQGNQAPPLVARVTTGAAGTSVVPEPQPEDLMSKAP